MNTDFNKVILRGVRIVASLQHYPICFAAWKDYPICFAAQKDYPICFVARKDYPNCFWTLSAALSSVTYKFLNINSREKVKVAMYTLIF